MKRYRVGVGRLGAIALALGLSAACGSDGAPPACSTGEIRCSDDGLELWQCEGESWHKTRCMADRQQLCDGVVCVDPWRHGGPEWDRCPNDPQATGERLIDKALGYEELARRLHVHPKLGWMMGVILPPGVSEADATYDDVAAWQTGENDGLWSALYLAAEAYRYGATHDPEALDMIKLLLAGQEKRMAITGVPGLYTRQLIPPDFPGMACPADPAEYVPDDKKVNNKWVRVGDDGCAQTVDPQGMQFTSSSHCGLDAFKGWCWLDNVSEDEYSGHMLAHAAVARLVDDAEVQQQNGELLLRIGEHLQSHGLELVDWDGRRTEHGRLWPTAVAGGYNATMSLAFVTAAAHGSGDPELQSFLDDCLLAAKSDDDPCVPGYGASPQPYDELVYSSNIWFECKTNWNNLSMHMLSLHTLLLLERDPLRRGRYQQALTDDMFRPPDNERPLEKQNNAFFDFVFAADKALGPASDGPAYDVVENGVCMLRQYPASSHKRAASCPQDKCVEVCKDRFDNPMTDYARPMAERCLDTFVWWGSPYSFKECGDDDRDIKPPTSYLLPYWMGRYYGFVDATM